MKKEIREKEEGSKKKRKKKDTGRSEKDKETWKKELSKNFAIQ